MTAINFHHATGANTTAALVRSLLVRVVATPVAGVSRWWGMRVAMRRLSAAPDAILHDIGVARSGIESAVRNGRQRS